MLLFISLWSVNYPEATIFKFFFIPESEHCDICRKDTLSVKQGDYEIKLISTYVNDSTKEGEALSLYPLIIDQRIYTYYKNRVTCNKPHNVPKISIESNSNGRFNILENKIIKIGIVNGAKESFFTIDGYGGCSTCTEYVEIMNKSGKEVFLLYHDYSKVISKYGILKNVLKNNKIDRNEYSKGNFLSKELDIQ